MKSMFKPKKLIPQRVGNRNNPDCDAYKETSLTFFIQVYTARSSINNYLYTRSGVEFQDSLDNLIRHILRIPENIYSKSSWDEPEPNKWVLNY